MSQNFVSNDLKLDNSYKFSQQNEKQKKSLPKSVNDYDEIKQHENNSSLLGRGSYGEVKLVQDKRTKQLYALKIVIQYSLKKEIIFQYATQAILRREILTQKKLRHPHIARLYNFFEDQSNVYLIIEYCKNGSLFDFLKKKKRIQEKEAFNYFFQTCLGLDYLHKKNILHRDLKPENLLLDDNFNIKMCDFGWCADDYSKGRTTFCGTVEYMAPEMIQGKYYDKSIDIWALGVLLYEILHGYPPFRGQNNTEKCENIINHQYLYFEQTISPQAINLIQNILIKEPEKRYTMNQIFDHPFLKQFEKIYNFQIKDYIYECKSNSQIMSNMDEQSLTQMSQLENEINYQEKENYQQQQKLSSILNKISQESTSIASSFGRDTYLYSEGKLKFQLEREKLRKNYEKDSKQFKNLNHQINIQNLNESKNSDTSSSSGQIEKLSFIDKILNKFGCFSRKDKSFINNNTIK